MKILKSFCNSGGQPCSHLFTRRSDLADQRTAFTAVACLLAKMAAGKNAGGIGQAIAVPCDLIKVRMQSDGRLVAAGKLDQPRYNGLFDAFTKIKAAEAAMVSELREKAASLAIASAAEIITAKLDDKAGMGLIDDAAKEIEKLN